MSILAVQGLCKHYPGFTLDQVSFELKPGSITGFIGRNGAGKTTTLKSLFKLVQPDAGQVDFFGQPFQGNEDAVKQRVGFVLGGVDYYHTKRLRRITQVTRSFYPQWDDAAYSRYMRQFALDDSKTPAQLSAGMRVKYALTLALSHNAELLILDEPTSGLDPVSRDELLEIFMALCDQGITLLFSTHITTDLDKCADNIIYIQNGKLVADTTLSAFISGYRVVEWPFDAQPPEALRHQLIGRRRSKQGYSALLPVEALAGLDDWGQSTDLEGIMVHMEREGEA